MGSSSDPLAIMHLLLGIALVRSAFAEDASPCIAPSAATKCPPPPFPVEGWSSNFTALSTVNYFAHNCNVAFPEAGCAARSDSMNRTTATTGRVAYDGVNHRFRIDVVVPRAGLTINTVSMAISYIFVEGGLYFN